MIIDGDTVQDRSLIRDNVHVLFTNPDTLHRAILPNHYRWRRFLVGLKLVLLDGNPVFFKLIVLKRGQSTTFIKETLGLM